MPRDASGNYSLPAGTLTSTGDTILVSQHNPAMQDLGNAVGGSLDRDGSGGMRAPLNMGGYTVQNVSPGVNPTDAATVSQLAVITGFPSGAIIDFAGSTIPSGWLLCGGQSLTRSAYPDLFAALGTAYGSASSTTFSLPDLRGRVTAGRDFTSGTTADRLTSTMTPNGTSLGAVGGTQTHTLTEAQMPAHTHTVTGTTNTTGAHTHTVVEALFEFTRGTGVNDGATVTDGNTGSAGDHSHSVTGAAATTGGGAAHPIVQPTILLNKIIKA